MSGASFGALSPAASNNDFFRDANGNPPDGVNDFTQGIAHDAVLHTGHGTPAGSRVLHEPIVSYAGNGSFQTQVITTTIPKDSTIMPTIWLKGYNYGTGDTIDVQLGLYVYNVPSGSLLNTVWVSRGSRQPTQIRAGFDAANMLVLEITWPAVEYFQRWGVSAYCDGNNTAQLDTWFEGWTIATGVFAGTVTNIVTIAQKFPLSQIRNPLQPRLMLNGAAKFSLNGELRWSNKFTIMTEGVTAREPSGYHDIIMPADGYAVPVAGGTTRAVVAATANDQARQGGILLNNWESLWYKVPQASGNGSNPAQLLIQPYNLASGIAPASAPLPPDGDGWVLLATRDDQSNLRLGTGCVLSRGAAIGNGHDETIANWTAMKARVQAGGYLFTPGGNTTIPLAFGFTEGIRWINGGSTPYLNGSGFIDVNQASKAVGTVVNGVNGAANRAWRLMTAAERPEFFAGYTSTGAVNRIDPAATTVVDLNDNETLYYVPNIESGGTNTGTWYVSGYSGGVTIPIHWLPVVSRQNTYTNNTLQILLGGVVATLRAGEAKWMGKNEAAIDMLHRRSGIQFANLAYCRFTQANFFAGAGANGLLSSALGCLVSWPDNNLMYGISDGYQGWGNQYSWINVPAAGYAIPVAGVNSTITRVVQTISGRRYVPLGYWEVLWYVPPAYAGGYVSKDGDWLITYYGQNHNVPNGAIPIARMYGAGNGTGAGKTRVKFADGTYLQPGLSPAVVGFIAENDHAQGSGDWRNMVLPGQTRPGMSAALAATVGVGAAWAGYPMQYRYEPIDSDPRGIIRLKGLLTLNNSVPSGGTLAFLPGVQVVQEHMLTTHAVGSTNTDSAPIAVMIRAQNATYGGQNGVRLYVSGLSLNTASPIWAGRGTPYWLSFDNLILPHS